MLERIRVWIVHKLKGVMPEDVRLPEAPQIKAYTAIPKKVSARMIIREGEEYPPAIVQQRLSYRLADTLVDSGFINFYSAEYPGCIDNTEIIADLYVIKKEE